MEFVKTREPKPEKIPDNILGPVLFRWQQQLKKTADRFSPYELECMRLELPPKWHSHPVLDLGRQAGNLRRKAGVGTIRGHGKSIAEPLSPELRNYYDHSADWKAYRTRVLEFWGYRCAVCNGRRGLQIHHRHYKTFRHETLTDCVALCKECHKVCDRRRKYEAGRPEERDLFRDTA